MLLGSVNAVKNYLLPLAKEYGDGDMEMLVEVCKLLVLLTMPIEGYEVTPN